MQEPTCDRSNDEIQWGDEIPFDGSPLPGAEAAYQWLLNSGVPDTEAWRRVWGVYVRPLVAANKWRQTFSALFDADDGYNPATIAPAWEPRPETMAIMHEIMNW